jgi:anti-sigma factor RsiW
MALWTPDWLLERLALGELSEDALATARERLEREPGGAARLARLEEDSRRTLERHPPAAVAAEVQRRVRTARARERALPARQGWWSLSLGVPVAASLALLFLTTSRELPVEPAPASPSALLSGERIKGTPRLRVHRQGAGEPEQLADGVRARPGDLLQLSYISGGAPYGVVLSLDGRGAVTLHHPAVLTGSTELAPGEAVALSHAYELDDAPGFERFVLVTSEAPVDVGSVLEAARGLARQPSEARKQPLPLPDGLVQTSFTLEKVP